MVPIKNNLIGLAIGFNLIGIIINFCLFYTSSSNKNKIYDDTNKVIVLILSGLSIYFTLSLIFTFNLENIQQKQETQANKINNSTQIYHSNHANPPKRANQRNNSNNNRGGAINFEGGGGDLGPLIIIIVVIGVIFSVLFLLVKLYKAMGRKNTAYCSLIFLTIIHMGISIICFGLIHHVNFYIIGGFSSCLFIFNFLIILIPNCRKRQINNDLENSEIKDPILMKENDSSKILVRDKCVTTPKYNQVDNSKTNEIEKPIESINPIDVYERNNEKYDQYFDDKNELLINQNDQISQTPNSRISDLSNAPLPNDANLPTEEEIYKNYSNL